MNSYQEKKSETLKRLGTDPEIGLKDKEVLVNREKYGSNSFTREKGKSVLKRIVDATSEPMIIMLLVAAIITLGVNLVQLFSGGETKFIECIGIFVAIFLAVGITVLMEGKSEKAFEALNAIKEDIQVKVLRNGRITEISQNELVVGDILEIATGDMIPVDGRLLESSSLRVDESSLTGESLAVKKDESLTFKDSKTPVAERANMLYSGCFIAEGSGKFITTAVGDRTEFGSIARELSKTDKGTTPLQEKMNRLGKIITILGSTAAAIVFTIQLVIFWLNGTFTLDTVSEAFITSIVLIVAAVPEGLPTIVAVSLSINIIKMAKENALVKKLIACETIGCINVICSDKTGTLTENRMTVTNVLEDNEIIKPGDLKSAQLIENFCVNTTAHIDYQDEKSHFIGSPTEGALLMAYTRSLGKVSEHEGDYRVVRDQYENIFTYPFTSETKNMTTVIKSAGDYLAFSKGSPESIFRQCAYIRICGDVVPMTPEIRKNIKKTMVDFQSQAKRVLAFSSKAMTILPDFSNDREVIESGMIFDGYVAITDPLRQEVSEAVKRCRLAGIDLKILTGDNIITAKAIAHDLGILENDAQVVESREIEELSDSDLLKRLPDIKVIARSTPVVKMRVVNALKTLGNVVAVTGDGINDAPAIKNADVGIAMGISGTEVSKEASDIVLLDDSFSTIVKAVQWGRGIYENFQRFIQFQLTVNVSSVIVVLVSILIGMKSPFTALQLLWVNIIMDGPPALTLGLEPIREDLMRRQPISRDASIVTKGMLARIAFNGVYISIIFMLQATTNFLQGAPGEMASILFTMFVVMHLFNAINSRELTDTSVFVNFGKNRLMLIVFGLTLLLQVIITQFGGVLYNTVPLSLMMWAKMIGLGLSVVAVSEIVKFFKRKIFGQKKCAWKYK